MTPAAGPLLLMQQYALENGCKAPYPIRSPEMVGPFLGLYTTNMFELENLALFNRAAYSTIAERNARADQMAGQAQAIFDQPGQHEDDDAHEMRAQIASRLRIAAYNEDSVSSAICRYADELCIIALWAFAERNINATLEVLDRHTGQPARQDHRWNILKTALGHYNISLEALDSYADADECRLVNNALKHSGKVSGALLAYPAFTQSAGASLQHLQLDTQRYYFGVSDFIGALLEAASGFIADVES